MCSTHSYRSSLSLIQVIISTVCPWLTPKVAVLKFQVLCTLMVSCVPTLSAEMNTELLPLSVTSRPAPYHA